MCVPVLGQGTWYMGEKATKRKEEVDALRFGIEHGMTLIDTAEMYGDGASEILVGEAIRPFKREDLFLISKVYPWNAGRDHIFESLTGSLNRLGTDYLDCYLLHWRGSKPLAETVKCMEELVQQGKIRCWGVSNFNVDEMEDLLAAGGQNCVTDQVLYHLGSRGVEVDLLPWLREHEMPLMAYSPLAQAGRLKSDILHNRDVRRVAEKHGISPVQVMLAFVLSQENVFAVPKASSVAHVKDNLAAGEVILDEQDLALLNGAYPVPDGPVPLDMV